MSERSPGVLPLLTDLPTLVLQGGENGRSLQRRKTRLTAPGSVGSRFNLHAIVLHAGRPKRIPNSA